MPAMDNKEYRRRLIAWVEALPLISRLFATPQAGSHVRTAPNSDQRDTPHSDQSYTQALIGYLGSQPETELLNAVLFVAADRARLTSDASSAGPLGQAVAHYRAKVRRKVLSTVSIANGKVRLRNPGSTRRKCRA